jgi:hypothetical protein
VFSQVRTFDERYGEEVVRQKGVRSLNQRMPPPALKRCQHPLQRISSANDVGRMVDPLRSDTCDPRYSRILTTADPKIV